MRILYQALTVLAAHLKTFPAEPALIVSTKIVHEASARYSNLVAEAREALGADALLAAFEQVTQWLHFVLFIFCTLNDSMRTILQTAKVRCK